ncbi:glycosyltransferase family 2 protein [Thioalkalicoccus limnaeus]|uniref:Glycosyltransferase family 2 protein n=1 Tax=Thioalkalicoccus limnaeus TaxID=120681 RepID=A0ABV4BHI0_9GAMM
MRTLVSILIPAFNAERYIGETLASALNQTWEKKEIIVVDDGSSDETLRIAKTFERANLKVISQENKGASAARNVALSVAQGDLIQWLDADDLLAPDKLAHQVTLYRNCIGGRVLISGAFGTFHVNPQRARFRPHSLWQDLAPAEFLFRICTENIWMNPAVWLVSRGIAEAAGPWDERLTLDDDGEYFSRVVASSEMIRFCPEAKAYYRQHHTGSLSRDVSQRGCESLLLSLQLRIRQLRKLEDSERTRRACVHLLQTWLDYFYPEKKDLLRQVYGLAGELGGTLTVPPLSWKYVPVRAMFGWPAAKKARRLVSNAKLSARVRIDGWLRPSVRSWRW